MRYAFSKDTSFISSCSSLCIHGVGVYMFKYSFIIFQTVAVCLF